MRSEHVQSCLLPGGTAVLPKHSHSLLHCPCKHPLLLTCPKLHDNRVPHDRCGTLLLQAQASAICTDKGALAQASAFAAASGSGTCTASAAAEAQAVCLVPTVFTQATASAFASEHQGGMAWFSAGLWLSRCLACRQSDLQSIHTTVSQMFQHLMLKRGSTASHMLGGGTLPFKAGTGPVALKHCFWDVALHWHHNVQC